MEAENKKILLVEDDPNFGAILKDYLNLNDFEVTLAKNGMEGFEKFKKDGFLILKNGTEIPVASRRKEAILEYFNQL